MQLRIPRPRHQELAYDTDQENSSTSRTEDLIPGVREWFYIQETQHIYYHTKCHPRPTPAPA